ncbi:Adenosylcobinamide-phosphate synthase [Thioalkalivibrio nitratireducens DSM 14787]|uniref:Cobalamin biosynthesis protein CobD n=1 Tax=Thioalkalivibrio nitratireducens (strain DSM 14787 / UNIQEM 213 / ALEN2) TaxID=1255043 RepID=L0E3B1_THIND|nr:adenosylcobinamide-phosphate synthase CbiB [Thioalkalivibrio nitratireducens]AGA35126.1 Adenosylcobinamide-phosphate synthase [Thioalkalivibrio nitratireducens DSM 14787]
MLLLWLSTVAAVLLDGRWGEPGRLHPLVGFGRLGGWFEARLNRSGASRRFRQARGGLAVVLLVVPATALTFWLAGLPIIGPLFGILVLYLALGHRSLAEHARPVAEALAHGDEAAARQQAGMLVSRDLEAIDPAPATIESVLENGHDAVFGALFWFVLLGPAGAVLFRLGNTLDALWGYRTSRYRDFGRIAARLDDLLGYLPARLTALSYALVGNTRQALRCWRTQGERWKSPNAGPVMAAGAGALGLQLGGPARYQGQWQRRADLGEGRRPDGPDIERALGLVRHALLLWLAALTFATLLVEVGGHVGNA